MIAITQIGWFGEAVAMFAGSLVPLIILLGGYSMAKALIDGGGIVAVFNKSAGGHPGALWDRLHQLHAGRLRGGSALGKAYSAIV